MGRPALYAAAQRLLGLLALWAALCLAPPAWAGNGAPANPQVASLQACIAPARPGDTPEALLAAPDRFDCRTRQTDLGPGSFWLRLPLPAQLPDGERMFSFVPAWQQSAALYYRDTGGALHTISLTNQDLSRAGRIGARSAIALPPDIAPGGALLLRIDGALNASGLLQMPQLESRTATDRQELGEAMSYAAFGGLAVALLAYNLLMWLAMRERFQLAYCLTLGAMLAYAFAHSGMLDIAFPALGAQVRLRFAYIALGLIAVGAQLFLVACLEPGMVSRRIWGATKVCATTTLLASLTVAFAFVSPVWAHLLDRVYVVTFVPLPALMVVAAVQAWRRGSQIVRLLALAWMFPLAMCLIRILHATNVIGFSLLVEHSVILALGLEALLSATAMSFRIKRIALERDTARTDEALARRLADVDPLTGLLNRRALLANALDWDSSDRLRLMLIDIDHFKAINDQYGHDAGDEVLREVAQVLARCSEIRATVARIGGEEFALLGTADELTPIFARRLLAEMRHHAMPGGLKVTISIGMAEGRIANEADWNRLFKAADEALYAAKQGGRDRVREAKGGDAAIAAAA